MHAILYVCRYLYTYNNIKRNRLGDGKDLHHEEEIITALLVNTAHTPGDLSQPSMGDETCLCVLGRGGGRVGRNITRYRALPQTILRHSSSRSSP